MGEYATYLGDHIKIGTCEEMLYLRAGQAGMVRPVAGSVDPCRDAAMLRFRFPWPDEDHIPPGGFDDPLRVLEVWRLNRHPVAFDHGTVQFGASVGYAVDLPCPESPTPATHGLTVNRRIGGLPTPVHLVGQRVWNGRLVAVCRCGGCRVPYRLEGLADAAVVVEAIRAMADRRGVGDEEGGLLHGVADRIELGYVAPLPAGLGKMEGVR